jgi:hypothetical protein
MPALARITNTFFVNLVNRLGIRPPPPEGFELTSVVTPVSIVDSDISVPVISTTQLLDTPATAGEQVAPAPGATLADTGQLAAGTYNLMVTCSCDFLTAGTLALRISRRNAADAADVWTQLLTIASSGSSYLLFQVSVRLLVNERIRLLTAGASPAGSTVGGNIWVQLVTAG